MTWMTCREDKRSGSIVYTYVCGHEHEMTKDEIHAYVTGNGPNVPADCPRCGGNKE